MKSSRRELIMTALLSNPTIREASKACGVPERTVYTWLNRADFKDEYNRRRSELVGDAWNGLRERIGDAIETVSKLMGDRNIPPQVRLNAARTVLEYSLRATEQLDILPRLEALEAAHSGRNSHMGGEVRWELRSG